MSYLRWVITGHMTPPSPGSFSGAGGPSGAPLTPGGRVVGGSDRCRRWRVGSARNAESEHHAHSAALAGSEPRPRTKWRAARAAPLRAPLMWRPHKHGFLHC